MYTKNKIQFTSIEVEISAIKKEYVDLRIYGVKDDIRMLREDFGKLSTGDWVKFPYEAELSFKTEGEE